MNILYTCWFFTALLLFCGLYCMLLSRNLLRTIIGAALIFKSCVLAVAACGFAGANTGAAQAIAITVIFVETIFCSIVLALSFRVRRLTGSLDIRNFDKLTD